VTGGGGRFRDFTLSPRFSGDFGVAGRAVATWSSVWGTVVNLRRVLTWLREQNTRASGLVVGWLRRVLTWESKKLGHLGDEWEQALTLAAYLFGVEYKPGTLTPDADGLSRPPVDLEG